MKKFRLFQILPLFAAILLVGCDRVEPGNVGIKVNKLGDDKGVGEVVGVGRYWTGWNTEVYIFPTFKQMKTYDEPFSFQMSDGTTIGYHIGVAYKVDPSKVTTVFQTYRKGVDDITDTDLRQKIADALNRLASKMTTDKFIDGGKSELLDSALKDIQAEMTPIGIQVMSLSYVGKLYYDNGSHAGCIIYIGAAQVNRESMDSLKETLQGARGGGAFKNVLIHAPNGGKEGVQILPFQQITAKDEFMNVKAASRDDVLAAHRVPPQLMGAMPGEKSAFGDVEKAARVYAINELMPVMEAMKHINDWLGEEVIRFNPYALLDTQPTS